MHMTRRRSTGPRPPRIELDNKSALSCSGRVVVPLSGLETAHEISDLL